MDVNTQESEQYPLLLLQHALGILLGLLLHLQQLLWNRSYVCAGWLSVNVER